ncbi:STAS/SEC14 domain-containing protein [Mycobacterium crocinum]|uniref:STAS/SEC14 domain-containing protein n=1 Tax=Mycolicibacterium crocinum TaxID=388459 RepID=A0ABY3TK95_9MYCO|nr:STAS/SEC14 domain-containing protein [Mycolicibacterium crocinum]MCV7216232.1 STAS/SEC14 domain-containing protein [Mycolicibacterium crocinum]ULN41157.1 STAS/SEC14 domain-containing protein [Mycolicibacterium crocinum]
MIEVLSDMPEGVTGIRVSGKVSGDDLKAFKPAMDDLMKPGGDIRIVEVIDSDYEGFGRGGLVEDLKLGLGTLFSRHSAFKRVAVVSDKEWVVHTIHLVGWLMPGEVQVFGLDELGQAKQWAAG